MFIGYLFALNKDFLSKWYPILTYYYCKIFGGGTKEIIFKPKDVLDNKAIIPTFDNVMLEYKCKGDFDKYLNKLEILEIPFNYKKGFKGMKKEKNQYVFQAVFHFLKKPKTGSMEVEFV